MPSAETSDGVRTGVDERGLARIEICRPGRMNALDSVASRTIIDFLTRRCTGEDVRVVVIDGAAGSFSTGADIRDIATARTSPAGGLDEEQAAAVIAGGSALARAVRLVQAPVIASVDGPAVGIGASLAFAADLVYATERSYFLLAFINIGLMPDGGASLTVAASMGRARANRLILLGEKLPAADAYQAGLVSALAADRAALDLAVDDAARKLINTPPAALRLAKRAVDATTMAGFDDALERETTGQTELLQSPEFRTVMAHFAGTASSGADTSGTDTDTRRRSR